jgi:hypothetical protein
MGILSQIFSGGASTLVDSVGKVLDNVITTKEEKQQLDNEIRKSEMQFQIEMQKMSLEEKQMVIGDIGNARTREVEIAKSENATRLSKNTLPLMALGTIVLSFILFYVLVFSPNLIPASSKDIVIYILGVLSGILAQVYSYYFGSSAGSADKQKTINSMRG